MTSLFLITTSFKSLFVNKKRTTLTMLGIVIGIAAVIIIFSVGAGAQSLIVNELSSIGSDLIGVMPGASDDSGPPASVLGITVTTLKEDDLFAVEKELGDQIVATS